MNPERILEDQADVDGLLVVMFHFADSMLTPEQRQATLKAAGARLYRIQYYADPVSFAQSLVATFIEVPVPEGGPQDHPMIRLLQYFLNNDANSFGLTDWDVSFSQAIITQSYDRFGALVARRCVGRIADIKGNGIGTGVLVGSNLLLTCQHVITKTRIERASVRFDYTRLIIGRNRHTEFELDVLNSIASGSGHGLDYVLLHIKGYQSRRAHTAVASVVNSNDEIRMIHHPQGEPIVVSDVGRVVHVATNYFLHDIPSQPASSGAPIFNREWELVGLHRGAGSNTRPGTTEGVPVHAFWDAVKAYTTTNNTP